MSYQFATGSKQALTAPTPVNGSGNFTLTLWARCTTSVNGFMGGIVRSTTTIPNSATFGQRTTYAFESRVTNTSGSAGGIATSSTGAQNVWQLVVARFTSTGGGAGLDPDVSRDAEAVATGPGGLIDPLQYIYIGGDPANSYPWAGQIADFAVWDKLLSDAEVDGLYISSQTGNTARKMAADKGITGNLKVYYPLITGTANNEDNDSDALHADNTYGGATYDLSVIGSPSYQSGIHPTLTDVSGASAAIPKTAGLFGGPFKRLITS